MTFTESRVKLCHMRKETVLKLHKMLNQNGDLDLVIAWIVQLALW